MKCMKVRLRIHFPKIINYENTNNNNRNYSSTYNFYIITIPQVRADIGRH